MGNNVTGSTKIAYFTKDGTPIDYMYYDLKGKNRFPNPPSNEKQIDVMFYKTLNEIQVTQQHLEILKDFNAKYKHRFVILHGRKVQEYKQKRELNRLRKTKIFDQESFKNVEENRKKELDDKLKVLQKTENALKMHIVALDRFILQKNLYSEFIAIDGIQRLVNILDKAITTNKQGTKTIFQNQIEILKFLKSISDHNPKEYFASVASIRHYPLVMMRAYHPVNIAVTAYVLLMLQDYSWKVQNNLSLMECLKLFKQENKHSNLLQPFIATIYHTDNILMCYYNLRFINELIISIVDQQEKREFEGQLRAMRYQLLIEDIKVKLQENYYKIDFCTFIAVSQAIYKHATKAVTQMQSLQQNLANRGTLSLQILQQHLLINFVEGQISKGEQNQEQSQDDDDDDNKYLIVYLAENDRKSFNKFIIDTFSEIQHYYKYTIIVDQNVENVVSQGVAQEMQKLNKHGLSVDEYLKRIKGNCSKYQCEDILLSCFKGLQYFQKNEWKKLEEFINEGMKTYRNITQIQILKKLIEEKEKEIQLLKAECQLLKTQSVGKIGSMVSLEGLPNLPPPPFGLPNLPPPPLGLPNLPPPPPLIGLPNLPLPPIGLPNIPIPPPIGPPPSIGPSSSGSPSSTIPVMPPLAQQKKKPKKQPKVNLKACNYTVLSYQKIKSTIWQKLDDGKVKINENQLQSLFARALPKKEEPKVSQSAILLSTPAKKEKIKLLPPDKYRNFEIILTKLKLPENAVTQALTQCSGKYAIPSVLESLYKILPSEEDELMVNGYDGSLDDLGTPQRFIKEITTIPEYSNRVKTLLFASHKDQLFLEIRTKIQGLTLAFQALQSNVRLHHVLQVALALGNYLNGTGVKGGAWGFKLDTIQSLQEVSSNDNKMNAAFYLIRNVWEKHPYPIFSKEDIDMYQYIQKMPTSQVRADLGELKKSITAIQKAIKSKSKNNSKDLIVEFSEKLLLQAKERYSELQTAAKKMEKTFTQCATFYCEDPNKAASDQIGKKIFKCLLFIFTTEKSYFELEERRKKEETRKMAKIQLKANQQIQKSQTSSQPNSNLTPKIPQGAIKLPMPASNAIKLPGFSAEGRLQQLQKLQKQKQKKSLEQTIKKRNSKMIAFRQSRLVGNPAAKKPEQQVQFLKGI